MRRSLLLVMLTALLPINALAVLSTPYGWYIEANVGTTKLFDEDYPPGASDETTWIGGNVNLGYKFMPFFAAEVGYTRYADTKIEDQSGTTAGEDQHYSMDLAAKGIIPFSYTGFEGFGKLGVQRLHSRIKIKSSVAASNIGLVKSSSGVTGFYLGAGVQYYFTPQMAVVAQWARANGNSETGTIDLYSIGVNFVFI